jgi:membrane protein implicated in regulation of membrane protease activity
MKKTLIICIIALTLIFSSVASYGATSDYQLAKNWANKHGGGYTIEKVITIAQGGYKGKEKGTKWTVKYPKKVSKGKRVTVYFVEKHGDICAMVTLGKVK